MIFNFRKYCSNLKISLSLSLITFLCSSVVLANRLEEAAHKTQISTLDIALIISVIVFAFGALLMKLGAYSFGKKVLASGLIGFIFILGAQAIVGVLKSFIQKGSV